MNSETALWTDCEDFADLVAALREDTPNKHDCTAAADAIARLELFRLGALRELREPKRDHSEPTSRRRE
jgi:hypothetical protein